MLQCIVFSYVNPTNHESAVQSGYFMGVICPHIIIFCKNKNKLTVKVKSALRVFVTLLVWRKSIPLPSVIQVSTQMRSSLKLRVKFLRIPALTIIDDVHRLLHLMSFINSYYMFCYSGAV